MALRRLVSPRIGTAISVPPWPWHRGRARLYAARVDFHLAELNIARISEPLDAEESAEFVAALGPVNTLAELSPGFVWRLTDQDGQSSSYVPLEGVDDPQVIVNYSIWTDMESLRHFMFRSGHAMYLRRRREWFDTHVELDTVCWWIPAGTIASLAEAYERLGHLREHGPSQTGWLFNEPLDRPDV